MFDSVVENHVMTVHAFECQLEQCFQSCQDFTFGDPNGSAAANLSLYTKKSSNLVFGLFESVTPFQWHSSNVFRAYIESLSLADFQKGESLNFDLPEDDDLTFAFDHHSLITSQLPDSYDEPIKTADEVIREINLIMGHGDEDEDEEVVFSPLGDECFSNISLPQRTAVVDTNLFSEANLNSLSLNQLNALLEDLEECVREYSAVLVQELAYREELDFEQEQKDVFIARLDEMHHRLERRRRRSSMPPVSTDHLPMPIPFSPDVLRTENSPSPVRSKDYRTVHKNEQAPVINRAHSAAQTAAAVASTATSLLKRHWHRLSRGPDELMKPAYTQSMIPSKSEPYPKTSLPASSTAVPIHTSRAATIARLRNWAGRKASEALNSGTSIGSFRALLRRANPLGTVPKMPAPCIREARSAATTPTSSQPDLPATLTHSASGHLVGHHEISSDDLEYKNLTTTIPYHRSPYQDGPTVEQLQLFNEMLLAILTNNPNLTTMLTDYILNVYAPADRRPSKLPI
ncbi:hypothetical protein EG68_07485 [Paragonimus skrjabini miyazakii]|uniref:Zygin n=1 Tax=Paragonimus skrjabini miyazakii TaxID=59628 RepID=A0A8S9Z1G5_9TREM|nr:hypothetical protein EG68_07485 [Paragonimus skrjabini miyazakii]